MGIPVTTVFLLVVAVAVVVYGTPDRDNETQTVAWSADVEACLENIKPIAISYGECLRAAAAGSNTSEQKEHCAETANDHPDVYACNPLLRQLSSEDRDKARSILQEWGGYKERK